MGACAFFENPDTRPHVLHAHTSDRSHPPLGLATFPRRLPALFPNACARASLRAVYQCLLFALAPFPAPSLCFLPPARIEEMRRSIGATPSASSPDDLQLTEVLGEGTFGKVYKGELSLTVNGWNQP